MAWLFLALSRRRVAWQAAAPEAWQFSRAFLPNKAQYFALGIVSAIVVREGTGGPARLPRRAGRHAGAVRAAGRHRQAAAAGGVDGMPCGAAHASSSPRTRGVTSLGSCFRKDDAWAGWPRCCDPGRWSGWARSRTASIWSTNRCRSCWAWRWRCWRRAMRRCSPRSGSPGAVALPILAAWWLHDWIELAGAALTAAACALGHAVNVQ